MGANFSRIKTWIAEVLTASDLNAEFDNVLNNFDPDGMDDASVNDAAMQATRDPYPGAAISKPTDLTGELQGLRFLTKQQETTSQWYIYPDLVSKTAAYTATQDDKVILGDASGGNFTVTLPTAVGILNKVFFIKNIGASGTVTVDGNASETIDGVTTKALGSQYEFIGIVSDNANWQTIGGLSANSVTLTGTQTLTNKTLTTPTIADLTNMTHGHVDAAGGGLIGQSGIDASAIGQGELKSTTGEVSTASTSLAQLTLPGGEYGFYPQIKMINTSVDDWQAHIREGSIAGWTSYVTGISMQGGSGGAETIYAQQRYIQASPPYKIGNILWGHFIFVLRNIATEEIVSSYQAEDPPWAYNGNPNYKKDDVKRIQKAPHPFVDYWTKDPTIDGLEVVLLDLKSFDMAKFKRDSAKIGKSILENMDGNINIPSQKKTRQILGIPEIIGFTDKVIFR